MNEAGTKRAQVSVPVPMSSREAVSWAMLAATVVCGALAAMSVALLWPWRAWLTLVLLAFVCWVGHRGALEIHQDSRLGGVERPDRDEDDDREW